MWVWAKQIPAEMKIYKPAKLLKSSLISAHQNTHGTVSPLSHFLGWSYMAILVVTNQSAKNWIAAFHRQ